MTGPTPPAGGAVTIVNCPACTTKAPGAADCRRCGGHGKRRAQLVLTVANIDTGAVTSANVTPGSILPTRDADNLFWCLDLTPVVADLADQVGATHIYEPDQPDDPVFAPWTDLPDGWQPDLPAAQRLAYETEAIVDEARDPWQIWLGRSTEPPPADPARRLANLCEVAELLCLDLVIEARRTTPDSDRLGWDVRFELPGSPAGDRLAPWSDLAEATVMTTVTRAAANLAEHGRHAPAHYIAPRTGNAHGGPGTRDITSLGPPKVDVDQLERRILADCTTLLTGEPTPGAHAIWRDGRWWHTTLRLAGKAAHRAWQPPPPSWQGPPIPYAPCPSCPPTPDLSLCQCPRIGGCLTCHGTHRIFHGTAISIFDGGRRVRHLTWPTPHHPTEYAALPVVTPPVDT
ncbi:hypothetical protein [Micromonospora sp. LOL_023]|uniref:hypothetical protein n=1 Tax=Micromonospora sp. LOL_023 TaxID=3345418 RepID=UPI003A8918D0